MPSMDTRRSRRAATCMRPNRWPSTCPALRVQAAGRLATQKKLCYLVDYQMPTDPINMEVVQRIHAGGLGRLGHIDSVGFSPPWKEWPRRTAEDRLRCWLTAVALSGDVITENSIHVINAVNWVAGGRPVCAVGRGDLPAPSPRRLPRNLPGDLRVCRWHAGPTAASR